MKKLIWIMICASMSFIGISADSKFDIEAKAIRKSINEIRGKILKAEATKKSMTEMQEEIKSTDVLDEVTIKDFEEANLLMEEATNLIKSVNTSLLSAELMEGSKRTSELKTSGAQMTLANEKLFKAQMLLTMIANKNQLIEQISVLVKELKSLNQNVVGQIEKELSGEKNNKESMNELSEKQSSFTKKISKFEKNLNSLLNKSGTPSEKELLIKVASLLLDDKVTSKSNIVESKIDAKELFVADITQKEIIQTLKKALNLLSPDKDEAEKENDAKKPENIFNPLALKIESQIQTIDGIIDVNEGNPDLTLDPKYNDTIGEQRDINKKIGKALNDIPDDPKTKPNKAKAIDASDRAKRHLENGEPAKAIEANKEASKAIASLIDDINKSNNQIANSKDQPKSAGKPSKDVKSDQNKGKDQNKEPVIAELNVDPVPEDAKADQFARDLTKVIIRSNQVQLGNEPEEKEVWLQENSTKNKAIFFQSIASNSPREYAEPTKKYFEVISAIGE